MSIKLTGQNGNADTLPGADIELDVVARIAAKAALGVKGVYALENTFADGIAAALGKDGVPVGDFKTVISMGERDIGMPPRPPAFHPVEGPPFAR